MHTSCKLHLKFQAHSCLEYSPSSLAARSITLSDCGHRHSMACRQFVITMPLTAESPTFLHLLQNVSLIALAALCSPLCAAITILGWIFSRFTNLASDMKKHRQWRKMSSPGSRKTVLVTGVGMSKGLAIARAFYRAGHNVIGADFEPYGVPVCGRFSTALRKFYRLQKPGGSTGASLYVRGLLDIILHEKIDLWISCSGVGKSSAPASHF